MSRPAVCVVVPFGGDRADPAGLARNLGRLELEPGDELIVADNCGRAAGLAGAARIVEATGERSSYHARNAGARAATREWVLFCDADCEPLPGLLDAYFADPVAGDVGVIAGTIVGLGAQDSLLARYTRERGFYDGERGIGANGIEEGGAAPTGNLLVRRATFERLGGFAEGIRSAGDFDLCWRAQAAGWRLLRRPLARVAHEHRDDLRSFLAMLARYGAGASWINRRYPGASPRWPLLSGLAGSARDVVVNARRGRRDEAIFRAIDALGLIAYNLGYRRSNSAPAGRGRGFRQ